jgi:hypothetical protein
LIGLLAKTLLRQGRQAILANLPLALSIAAEGLMMGGGIMYTFLLSAALHEPSTTYAVLSALMKPAVPFYILLNTAMELLLVPLIVFWNWNSDPKRRTLILIGVLAYVAMRVWTYWVYAEMRLDISQHTLSAADVAWFQQTLATDFRIGLHVITLAGFLWAAFLPASTAPLADR